jgi:hypothetical protein
MPGAEQDSGHDTVKIRLPAQLARMLEPCLHTLIAQKTRSNFSAVSQTLLPSLRVYCAVSDCIGNEHYLLQSCPIS